MKELTASADAPPTVEATDVRFFNVVTAYRHDGSTNPAKDAPTPLHANSDFQHVWNPEGPGRCFFSNDLDKEHNYSNSHRVGSPDEYDYNATIVWPIQFRQTDGRVRLWGFLCVDSRQRGVFEYHNDFALGAAYADTLYTVLSLWRDDSRSAVLDLSASGNESATPAGTSAAGHDQGGVGGGSRAMET